MLYEGPSDAADEGRAAGLVVICAQRGSYKKRATCTYSERSAATCHSGRVRIFPFVACLHALWRMRVIKRGKFVKAWNRAQQRKSKMLSDGVY